MIFFRRVSFQNKPLIVIPVCTVFLLGLVAFHPSDSYINCDDVLTQMVFPSQNVTIKEKIADHFLRLRIAPWKEDPLCKKFSTTFIQKPKPPMALVSFPGSGNTWIRQIIEQMTGHFSGSLYGDHSIFMKGKDEKK